MYIYNNNNTNALYEATASGIRYQVRRRPSRGRCRSAVGKLLRNSISMSKERENRELARYCGFALRRRNAKTRHYAKRDGPKPRHDDTNMKYVYRDAQYMYNYM